MSTTGGKKKLLKIQANKKNTNIWRLNNMLINNQQIMEEIFFLNKGNQNIHRNK